MTARDLAGRGAVVTGASRGLGAAVARALVEAGARVVIVARTRADLETRAAALRSKGGEVWPETCDVTDEASVSRLGQNARTHLGAVDVLVNNAGDAASAPLAKITLDDWNRMLAIDATSAFLATREFAPAMVERGWGRIVNVASIAGLEGAKYIAHYCAAKHAVIGLTRAVAVELAGSGVTVNAVCPGYLDTPLTQRTLDNVQARTGLPRDRALTAVLASAHQTRLMEPEAVADTILSLVRDPSAEATGRIVRLAGDDN